MDAVERENADRQKRWAKEQKVGEGTYAVVYKGSSQYLFSEKAPIKKKVQEERPLLVAKLLSRR
jgi:cyclin-dependent kinase 7